MSDPSHDFPAIAPAAPPTTASPDRALRILVAASLAVGLARRALLGWDGPLSLDETWTGAFSLAPDIPTLVARCLAELNGPVFYLTQWLWAKPAGVGDLALRLPAILFAILMPLLILWRGHPDRQVRLIWAGLAATWLPGTIFAGMARPYALVILLASAQAIVLARFLRRPTLGLAFGWSALSALMILSHYDTAVLVATQGIAILARGRAAWRCWPALALFVPVGAWMAVHLPLLMGFARPDVAWYDVYDLRRLAAVVPAATFGLPALGLALAGAVAATTVWSRLPGGPRLRAPATDVTVALSGLAAILIVAVTAMVRPSFSPRYLLPYMPAVLLGLSVWAETWRRRWPMLPPLLLGLFLLPALGEARLRLAAPPPDFAHAESFEGASRAIAAVHPKRLFALFDGPGSLTADPAMLADIGGFYLARAGQRVAVTAPILAGTNADPNRVLTRLADRPGDAILWIYDPGMHGTRGAAFPARIAETDPRWRCADHGTGALKVIACVQR